MQWLLLDETVKYGQLLQPGEQFAVYCPTVRRYQQHPTAEAELVLESSGGLWTLVRADDNYIHSNSSNSGQQDTAGKHAEHCSLVNLEQSTMFDSCMDVVVGQQDAVLCGVVSNISSSSGCNGCSNGKGQSDSDSKGAVTCYFADTIADMAGGRCLQLQLQFQPGSRTRAKVSCVTCMLTTLCVSTLNLLFCHMAAFQQCSSWWCAALWRQELRLFAAVLVFI